jgi:hypothetical protein
MVLKLVDGRIVFTPQPEQSSYEFNGRTVLNKLLAGLIGPEIALPVKSQDTGNRSRALLLASALEWRRDDQSRASAPAGVAI